jgi:hypothetical protein
MDQKTAWRKILRWKAGQEGFRSLFHYLPKERVYMIASEVEYWFTEYDQRHRVLKDLEKEAITKNAGNQ